MGLEKQAHARVSSMSLLLVFSAVEVHTSGENLTQMKVHSLTWFGFGLDWGLCARGDFRHNLGWGFGGGGEGAIDFKEIL